MALTNCHDVNWRILNTCDCKSIIRLSGINRLSYQILSQYPIYTELSTFRTVKKKYQFDSDHIGIQYHKYGMYYVIDKLHPYQGWNAPFTFEIAAKYGHLNIICLYLAHGFVYKGSRAIDLAAANGHTHILDWWVNRDDLEFTYGTDAVDGAATNGHVNVLEWFISRSELTLQYSNKAGDGAAANGHIHVLNWFVDHNLTLAYSNRAVDFAAKNNHISVLYWFHHSQYRFLRSYNAIDYAARHGHKHIIMWFIRHNIFFRGLEPVDEAAAHGHIDILNLFEKLDDDDNHVFSFMYSKKSINLAAKRGYLSVLAWFWQRRKRWHFKYDHDAIKWAAEEGHIDVLAWFASIRSDDYPFYYSIETIEGAAARGQLAVLQWFQSYDLVYRCFSPKAFKLAVENNRIEVIKLFHHSGHDIGCIKSAIDIAATKGHVEILEFLDKSGLKFPNNINVVKAVVKVGRLNTLIWFQQSRHRLKCSYDIWLIVRIAAKYGHCHILKWLIDQQLFHYYENAIAVANKYGQGQTTTFLQTVKNSAKHTDKII